MQIFARDPQKKADFKFHSEKIAYWFFRLNGCLSLENFLIHHEKRGREGTEVDILSVRFPYRQELLSSGKPMPDHPIFKSDGKIDIIFAEVKKGRSGINSSWLNPDLSNIERILHIIGFVSSEKVPKLAEIIYKNNFYENTSYRIRLFAIGSEKNTELSEPIIQLEWRDILLFIHNRFLSFWGYKRQHRQWDETGKWLIDKTYVFRDSPEAFVSTVIENMVD